MIRFLTGTLLVVLLLCRPTHCWLASGHALIASIAENHMDQRTRKGVDDLLKCSVAFPKVKAGSNQGPGLNPTEFSTMCSTLLLASTWFGGINRYEWEDEDMHHMMQQGHFLSVRINLLDAPLCHDRDKLRYLLDEGIKHQPHNVVTFIKRAVKTLVSVQATKEEQAIALRILLHCLGDMHQPLHLFCPVWMEQRLRIDTRGGIQAHFAEDHIPSLQIVVGPDPSRESTAQAVQGLHLYFDAMLGCSPQFPYPENSVYYPQGIQLWEKYRDPFTQYLTHQAKEIGQEHDSGYASIEDWALQTLLVGGEILVLEQNFSYVPGFREDQLLVRFEKDHRNFHRNNDVKIYRQISLAGLRLARILNAIYNPFHTTSVRDVFLIWRIANDKNIQPFHFDAI